ncbi:MAG: RsmD family RNA methyltransferase [Acholeplasmataceae bacterium]|nr:RsmD family RNA methyltransferase [Acholeplasmataceae bacterium]
MRIVGGKHRGRNLLRVNKPTTRETSDFVKESVFGILGGRTPGIVLDLFAGAGSYGLEAISRGASLLYAVDSDMAAILTIVENAKNMGETDKLKALHRPYDRFLNKLNKDVRFDLVFLDPPYFMNICEDILIKLYAFLSPSAKVVCETNKFTELGDVAGYTKIKERVYGRKKITIYQK